MTLPPGQSEATPSEAARWRTFLQLWGSQALSVLGSGLSGFALNIYLTQTLFPLESQRPQLAGALAMTALGWTFAALLGAPLAGALADRWNRRRMMMTCDALGALLLLGLTALILLGTPPVWALVVFTTLLGLVGTFHGSAFDTSYSALVPRDRLPRANGMMQTLWSLSGLLSPALAALLIGLPALARGSGAGWLSGSWLAGWTDGVPLALLVDAVSFMVATVVVWRLRLPSPRRADLQNAAGPRPSLAQDMKFGWSYIFARRPLLHLLLTFAAVNLMTSGVGVLHPLLVKFTLAQDVQARGLGTEAALATLWTAMSVGGLAGGLLVSAWGGLKRQRVLGVLVPMVLAGAAHALSGVAGTLGLTAVCITAFGMMTPVMNAHSQSIWQSQVPPEMQGRVFSVRRLIAQFTTPVATAGAGLLGAHTSPGLILLWTGLAMLVASGFQLLNPALRRVDDLPVVTAPAGAAG
ncbi:MFS transporter [Deinococcus navajonensis]|uniref:MFS transporter n=1 Tax=Deinococcus navajonensis TaxID=309884 RepID=A0ABV8XR42_9DEIO